MGKYSEIDLLEQEIEILQEVISNQEDEINVLVDEILKLRKVVDNQYSKIEYYRKEKQNFNFLTHFFLEEAHATIDDLQSKNKELTKANDKLAKMIWG